MRHLPSAMNMAHRLNWFPWATDSCGGGRTWMRRSGSGPIAVAGDWAPVRCGALAQHRPLVVHA